MLYTLHFYNSQRHALEVVKDVSLDRAPEVIRAWTERGYKLVNGDQMPCQKRCT
jgi:hypothetical protein